MNKGISKEISNWISMQRDAMQALLRDLVNIDSGSYDKEGVDAVGRRIRDFLAEFDIETKVHAYPDFGDVITAYTGGIRENANSKFYMLMGHRDTVFPKGEAAKRPFTIDNGRAYGPGVADMKGGLVINAFVLAAFNRFAPQIPMAALFTSDEEIGSGVSRKHIEEEARKAIAVFNSEPGRANGNIVIARKGGMTYNLRVEGKAAHSGVNFTDGVSAITEIAGKIVALSRLTDLEQGVTVNVGLVQGGQSTNTVAPSAECGIDVRFITNDQRDYLIDAIRQIAENTTVAGTSAQLTLKSEFLPMVQTAENQALADVYLSSATEAGLKIDGEFTGGCADSGFTSSLGIPTLCGLGPVGGKAHTADEYIELNTLYERAQVLADTICKLHGRTDNSNAG